ncbi:hypothetical protein PU560_05545, partial [Georgenia sp. 10Sc9-8]|nr:hypothetical protein [Georgenia halotolerans]
MDPGTTAQGRVPAGTGATDVRVAMARSRVIVTVHPTEGTRNAGFFTEAADTVLRCLLKRRGPGR